MGKRLSAFDKGFAQFKSGPTSPDDVMANPYKENSWDHKEWERGFNTAYFENLDDLLKEV